MGSPSRCCARPIATSESDDIRRCICAFGEAHISHPANFVWALYFAVNCIYIPLLEETGLSSDRRFLRGVLPSRSRLIPRFRHGSSRSLRPSLPRVWSSFGDREMVVARSRDEASA